MRLRYGDNFAGSRQAVAYGETIRLGDVSITFHPAGHVLGSAQIAVTHGGSPHRCLRRLQGRPRPDLRAVRGGAVRRLHHRGHVRTAGVPSWRRGVRSEQAAGLGRAVSGTRASGRCLFARQGAARDRADPRGRLRRADLSARRDGQGHALLSKPRHRAWRPAVGQGDEESRPCGHHYAGAALGHLGSLDAALSRSGDGVCVGLDAGARASSAARCRTAAGHLGSCRLGWPDSHDRCDRGRRDLGDARPGRCAGALVHDEGSRRASAGAGRLRRRGQRGGCNSP